jgi:hypothetical protein
MTVRCVVAQESPERCVTGPSAISELRKSESTLFETRCSEGVDSMVQSAMTWARRVQGHARSAVRAVSSIDADVVAAGAVSPNNVTRRDS